jgi:hypothetical protein
MGVLGWGSTAPWLRRILGTYGRADLGSVTRDAERSRPKLPGNRVRLPGGATSTHDGEPAVHLDAAPSLRLTRPSASPDTHFPVDPAAYLQVRAPEWMEYERQERVCLVVSVTGRLNVYVDRTCAPVMAALERTP